MQIPMPKMLITYRDYPKEVKVLCEYIHDSNDKYASIHLEQRIEQLIPHEMLGLDEDMEISVNKRHGDGSFAISYWENGERARIIDAFISFVLEYDGKTFALPEVQYDVKENDY